MKKLLLGLYIFVLAFFTVQPGLVSAADNEAPNQGKTIVHLFSREGCPHCAALKTFLKGQMAKGLDVELKEYEVIKNRANADLLKRVAQAMDIQVSGVPFTVVGNRSMIGYSDDYTSGTELMKMITAQNLEKKPDIVTLVASGQKVISAETGEAVKTFKIPFFGLVDARNISLPFLTVLVGSLDSLNPCAMWVLLFLIGVLFKVQTRSRQWLLGWVFLGASSVAYFVFLSAWLNIYMFLSVLTWIRFGIAAIAITVGAMSLKDFYDSRDGGCEIAEDETKRKIIISKIKQFAQNKSFMVAIFGLALVGAGVNLIELLCSAGLPAVYVPILISAKLPMWQYYAYLLLYVFFYMLPQLAVFLLAMVTMKQVAISSRVTRWFGLASGILMLVLGLLMAVKPEWLTFSF
jgi:glutaredoxin